jgi:hypothetical protein
VPVRLRAGTLNADLKLDFEQVDATPQVKISGGARLQDTDPGCCGATIAEL